MKLQRKPLKVIITLGLHIFYHNNRLKTKDDCFYFVFCVNELYPYNLITIRKQYYH